MTSKIAYEVIEENESASTKTTITDANGNTNEETTNAAGLTVQTKSKEGTGSSVTEKSIATNVTYYEDGNKKTETFQSGAYKKYSYLTGRSLLEKTELYQADGSKEQVTTYTYDSNDKLLEMKDSHIVSGKEEPYRSAKVKSGTETTEKPLRTYTYDKNGKVEEIRDNRSILSSEENDIIKTYSYDTFDRVSKMEYKDSKETSKVLESYMYAYDKNSNIKKKTVINDYPEKDTDKVNETKDYTYDALGRLISTVTTNHKDNDKKTTATYTYDKVGNRLSEDDGTKKTTYDYNGLDQMKTATVAKGLAVDDVRSYTYDVNGNQTEVQSTKTGNSDVMTYDADNRLSTVGKKDSSGATSVIQQNTYNGEGQRIQKVEASGTSNYFYQDGVASYTTDGTGSQTSQNIIGLESNVIGTQRYADDNTKYYTYNKDIQGSTSSLVKEDGTADVTYTYSDYGETTSKGSNQSKNEVCYTGGIYDATTGQYYLNARYYNPEDASFTTEDTYRGEASSPSTQNLYTYCAGNPVNYVDPSGHSWKGFEWIKKKSKCFFFSGKAKKVMKQYNSNLKINYSSGIINTQSSSSVSKLLYKNGNVKKYGCAVIAVYNFCKSIGGKKQRNFRKLLAEFYYNDDSVSSGTSNEAIGNYLKSHAIKYSFSNSLSKIKKANKKHFIVNMDEKNGNSAHSFYMRRNSKGFRGYNMYDQSFNLGKNFEKDISAFGYRFRNAYLAN